DARPIFGLYQDPLHGEQDPRQLAARGDAREGPELLTGIGAEKELGGLQPPRTDSGDGSLAGRLEADRDLASRHAERGELLRDGLAEGPRRRPPLLRDLLGERPRHRGESLDLRLAPRQLLVVVLERGELRAHLVAPLQRSGQGAAVLARDAPQDLDALVELLEALRVASCPRRIARQL